MDCPTCSKMYPDDAKECPHCATSVDGYKSDPLKNGKGSNLDGWWDVGPDVAADRTLEWREKPQTADDPGTWANLLKSTSDNLSSQTPEAAKPVRSGGFILPSQANRSSRADRQDKEEGKPVTNPDEKNEPSEDSEDKSPRPDKSHSKAFGRSAEVQEAPLHDSWSSKSDDKKPTKRLPPIRETNFQDGWSSGGSSEEREPARSAWAAALRAASSNEPADHRQQNQEAEVPRPRSIVESFETGPAKATKKKSRVFFKLLAGFIVLLTLGSFLAVSYHFLAREANAPIPNADQASATPPKDDATIWLDSAQESLASKDFELAAAQLERAVVVLKKHDKKRLKEAQIMLAKTYIKAGNNTAGATLWKELARSYPDLKKKAETAAAAAHQANRLVANNTVKLGERAVAHREFDKAIEFANEGLRIYQLSQGQNSQKARAYGVLGDAYLGQQNTRVAFLHFSKAQQLDPQGRYGAELGRIQLPVRPKPRPAPAERAKPKFVIETDVPQAGTRR